MAQGRRRRLDGEGGERRRAVGVARARRRARAQRVKMIAVERFRRRRGRNRGLASSARRARRRRGRSPPARRPRRTRAPRRRATKSSISAFAGPVSKATISPPGAEIGDVADAAPVEQHQRLARAPRDRGVIERDQRRALAAGGDVGGAEIADHVDARARRRARAVAELAGKALARPMQHRLAVQADERDRSRASTANFAQERSTAATWASVTARSSSASGPARAVRGRRRRRATPAATSSG